MRRWPSWALGLVVSACTVPGDSSFEWDPWVPPTADTCEVARKVFLPYCVTCHEGQVQELDLRPEALGALANQVSPGYAPMVLVVPGNREASLLYRKSVAPGPDDGDPMPPTTALPEEAIAALGAWIDAGAPPCEGEPVPLVMPGGPIAFGGPPVHYTTERPAHAPSGECTSEQWWVAGETESPSMHPGWDCIDCHARSGEGPRFAYAGTVYASLTDPDDCRGVPGVTVELLDLNGDVFARTKTNEAGNFGLEGGWRDGYRVRLAYQGRTREMQTPQASGACNSCHGPVGTEGAPGRVVAP